MSDPTTKIIVGPGKDRWPGSPVDFGDISANDVASAQQATELSEATTRKAADDLAKLRVTSIVQSAVIRFGEDIVRLLVEQGYQNARYRSDYT